MFPGVGMTETVRVLLAEPAEESALAPFGWIIGPRASVPARPVPHYNGESRKPVPFAADGAVDFSVVTLNRRPPRVQFLERHFKHTQAFVSLGGKPFVAVFAPPGDGDMPDLDRARAFHFDGDVGFCMKIGTWHEFPFALQDDTNMMVILTRETQANLEVFKDGEAHGADLDKKNMLARTGTVLEFRLQPGE